MTQLNGCITFWEVKLAHDRYLMAPATQALIENTVRYLKELEKLQKMVQEAPWKVTTIGEERSVPSGTQIRFLFEEEYQALLKEVTQ